MQNLCPSRIPLHKVCSMIWCESNVHEISAHSVYRVPNAISSAEGMHTLRWLRKMAACLMKLPKSVCPTGLGSFLR